MRIQSENATRLSWLLMAVLVLLVTSPGCYQRKVAPELCFDQSQVDVLDGEIQKFDWE